MTGLEQNDEQTPAAERIADEGNSRRGALKRAGLAAAGLATATFASSKASSQEGKKAAGPMDEETLSNQIIVRAFNDDAFKKRLLADPRMAVTEFLGKDFPAEIEVKVVQDTPKTVHLVLPDFDSVGERPTTKPEGDKDNAGWPWWHSRNCCIHDGLISRKRDR